MARIIKATESVMTELRSAFESAISKMKMFDGKFSFSKDCGKVERKTTVWFTPTAYLKMMYIIQAFDSEVAWHGVAKRTDDGYLISDILVYPQEVSGVTVDTDQEKYAEWLLSHDDETYNNIRMQGHSHVNMPTSPSQTDLLHQEKLLSQVGDEDFYIFMIYNKSMNRTIKIYDLRDNVLFENEDVVVDLVCAENFPKFIEIAKSNVKRKTYQSTYNGSTYGSYTRTSSGTYPYTDSLSGTSVYQTTQGISSKSTATGSGGCFESITSAQQKRTEGGTK